MLRWHDRVPGPGAPQDRFVVAVFVALLGLSSVLVRAAGPTELGPARIRAIGGLDRQRGAGGPVGDEAPQELVLAEAEGLPGWLLVVAWTLGLLCVGYLVARSLRRATPDPEADPRSEPARAGNGGGVRLTTLGGLQEVASAAAVELRRVSGERVPDVVVRSWERLEEVAAALGSGRPPHMTPTEFTAELLTRHGADEVATGDLLRLYHRARFSAGSRSSGADTDTDTDTDADTDADPASAAVAAFEAVAASLSPSAAAAGLLRHQEVRSG